MKEVGQPKPTEPEDQLEDWFPGTVQLLITVDANVGSFDLEDFFGTHMTSSGTSNTHAHNV